MEVVGASVVGELGVVEELLLLESEVSWEAVAEATRAEVNAATAAAVGLTLSKPSSESSSNHSEAASLAWPHASLFTAVA